MLGGLTWGYAHEFRKYTHLSKVVKCTEASDLLKGSMNDRYQTT